MIKGPKAILSSAISNALGEYFEVDADKIESNLLHDTKIVLNEVKLKKQVSRLPINSAGCPTDIIVTGCVEEVAFTWAWSVGGAGGGNDQKQSRDQNSRAKSWFRDATLTITGLKLEARLEHGTKNYDDVDSDTPHNEAFVDPATIDASSEKAIEREQGGIAGFVRKQVRMIIDMLTLRIVGFDFTVVLPPPLGTEVNADSQSEVENRRTLKVGGDEIELLSIGRDGGEDMDRSTSSPSIDIILRQELTFRSFYSIVVLSSDKASASHPLVEPFTYSATATRLGERFGGFATGLEVVGVQPGSLGSASSSQSDGLVFHAGTTQLETMTQLGVLLLAPPDEAVLDTHEEDDSDGTTVGTTLDLGLKVSSFSFPLPSVALVISEGTRITASAVDMQYLADGTVCLVSAKGIVYESAAGGEAEASGVTVSMRPVLKLTIDAIDSVCIPGAFRLSKPIHQARVVYEGETLSFEFDAIDAVMLIRDDDNTTPSNDEDASPVTRRIAPCSIELSISHLHLKRASDETALVMSSLTAYANPSKDRDSTQIALRIDEFNKSGMMRLTEANVSATLFANEPNTFYAFNFAAKSAKVTAGHSADEWSDQFRPEQRGHEGSKKASSTSDGSFTEVLLPNANIAATSVVITWAGTGVKVSDTSLVIKPFKGKSDTTSKDIISYYTKACLSRVPDFVSNAEVLGLNVVDSTAVAYGTWLGATTLGPAGGVAAVTAVDGVKGAVAAGKRCRKVDEGEGWRPGDVIRGMVYAAGEATRDGAIKRGKEDGRGNAIDWAVGATSTTGEYVVENKSRLGAAGAGGGGFLVGMAVAGPVGGIMGGLIASMATGKAVDSLEERSGKAKGKAQGKKSMKTIAE